MNKLKITEQQFNKLTKSVFKDEESLKKKVETHTRLGGDYAEEKELCGCGCEIGKCECGEECLQCDCGKVVKKDDVFHDDWNPDQSVGINSGGLMQGQMEPLWEEETKNKIQENFKRFIK
tara:strand:+ start:169 stop:528 length:360 start_codon:yes stop_codon:yes gene_type:complete